MNGNLVSTAWLKEHLGDKDLAIVDASWHMPAAKRQAREEFLEKHIPGARFYDLDAGSDPVSTLPHMLPPAEKFASDMAALGISDSTTVVVYDMAGLFSAARLWWMLKTFGHHNAKVLDGGLPKWEREARPLQSGEATPVAASSFKPDFDPSRVRNIEQVATALRSGSAQVADARSPTRFRGEEVEPRPGVRAGHMPGARNVHYSTLLNADGTLKSGVALRTAFEQAGIDLKRPVITSCGSGVTAAILALGLSELGHANHALYDGSWTEWGASSEALATGHA